MPLVVSAGDLPVRSSSGKLTTTASSLLLGAQHGRATPWRPPRPGASTATSSRTQTMETLHLFLCFAGPRRAASPGAQPPHTASSCCLARSSTAPYCLAALPRQELSATSSRGHRGPDLAPRRPPPHTTTWTLDLAPRRPPPRGLEDRIELGRRPP
jgi:hypothetical protein